MTAIGHGECCFYAQAPFNYQIPIKAYQLSTMTCNQSHSTHCLPPTELLPWLGAKGSLTAMLEERAGQPLRVKRSFEGYRQLSLMQKKQLGITGGMLGRPLLMP